MSLSICTSCLARLQLSSPAAKSLSPLPRIPSSISSFHSSASNQNVLKKKSAVVAGTRAPKLRESRSARIKKNKKQRPKPPPIGQRFMERRRIVLSNTNALEIRDLEKLSASNMADAASIGKMMALDGPLLDQLRESKAFKTTQNWNLFRMPSTLLRKESVTMGANIQEIEGSVSGGDSPMTIQQLVIGEKASGKSIHMLQAMSMAFLKKWVVVNIPDCQEFVINQSAYAPVPRKEGEEPSEQMYVQPQLAASLLTRVAHSNGDVLSKLKIAHTHGKTITARKAKTLKDLALIGANDWLLAPRAWDALWKELTVRAEGKDVFRPPVLVALDGVNFWMGDTRYRNADYKIIHAHQFTLIKQFLDLLFSDKPNPLGYGGLVTACTTKSNHPKTPAFDLVARQLRALENGIALTDPKFPLGDPYSKLPDPRVAALFNPASKTTVTELGGLSRSESKGLLNYFARSGILKEVIDDAAVAEKWTMSGGGIVGELCKLGASTRIGMFPTMTAEGTRLRA